MILLKTRWVWTKHVALISQTTLTALYFSVKKTAPQRRGKKTNVRTNLHDTRLPQTLDNISTPVLWLVCRRPWRTAWARSCSWTTTHGRLTLGQRPHRNTRTRTHLTDSFTKCLVFVHLLCFTEQYKNKGLIPKKTHQSHPVFQVMSQSKVIKTSAESDLHLGVLMKGKKYNERI